MISSRLVGGSSRTRRDIAPAPSGKQVHMQRLNGRVCRSRIGSSRESSNSGIPRDLRTGTLTFGRICCCRGLPAPALAELRPTGKKIYVQPTWNWVACFGLGLESFWHFALLVRRSATASSSNSAALQSMRGSRTVPAGLRSLPLIHFQLRQREFHLIAEHFHYNQAK